jgi:hypothetical protein
LRAASSETQRFIDGMNLVARLRPLCCRRFACEGKNNSCFIITLSRAKPLHNGLFAFARVLLRGEIGRCEAVGNENMKRKNEEDKTELFHVLKRSERN